MYQAARTGGSPDYPIYHSPAQQKKSGTYILAVCIARCCTPGGSHYLSSGDDSKNISQIR